MAATDPQPVRELDIREQIARIDNLMFEIQRKQREYDLAAWKVAATIVAGAAACFVGGMQAALHFH